MFKISKVEYTARIKKCEKYWTKYQNIKNRNREIKEEKKRKRKMQAGGKIREEGKQYQEQSIDDAMF